MTLVKTLFILSLANLILLVSILFYFSSRSTVPLVPEVTVQPTPTNTPAKTITVTPPAKPTVVVTPTPNPLAGHCLITIDSVRYDVTNFRNQHSGGDVFTCGADLSQLFHDRHSNRFLDIMAQFRI